MADVRPRPADVISDVRFPGESTPIMKRRASEPFLLRSDGCLLYPEVGRKSDIAQPGGFRRQALGMPHKSESFKPFPISCRQSMMLSLSMGVIPPHVFEKLKPTPGTKTPLIVYVLSGFASISGMLFGYDTGIVSGAMLLINNDFHLEHEPVKSEMIVSATVLFAIVGSVLGGPLNSRVGRKKSTLIASILFAVGAAGFSFSSTTTELIVLRSVLGVAVGLASQGTPMYVAETAPAHLRGALTSSFNFSINCGQVIACVVAGSLCHVPEGWRWMMTLAGVPAVVQFVGMLFLPESPRWFAEKGRREEALAVLVKLRKDPHKARVELDYILAELDVYSQQTASTTKASMVAFRKELLLGCGLLGIQAFTGINTVMYYSSSILKMAGMGESQAIWGAVLPAFGNASVAGFSMLIVERTGRRSIALFSLFWIAVTLVLMSLSFHVQHTPALHGYGGICVLVCMMGYIVAFAIGMSPVPWIVNSEIYPLQYRSVGTSAATMLNWTSNFIVSMTFLSVCKAIQPEGAFLLYAGVSLFGFFFVYFLLPETGGKTLEEVQALFEPRPPKFDVSCASEPLLRPQVRAGIQV
uniref:Hexose transporter 1 n=1 Tax=Noctiluca scintillans TaxID=2966 RepID=A0A7S1APB2_NOCSC|mmetsp:Transcript_54584/g.145783  ORF Transcript_54584/g.145783 Transcript_54584/m.145783 type:complete len:583 (+) Transcript_54584:62-1810(+)|eukprot:CAMPEP_0194533618 /NCGR_PEP_ID=MMETSP0253-20130528/71546_1 /TAXON_ID=2966 /ORGANISM="Noctiluca scintillans" /LENGTH=582 /DNA_ID=CAMNT_0039379183 /DNA_START=11 /DNA_END=1759 /DNA_ORIENTATION=-